MDSPSPCLPSAAAYAYNDSQITRDTRPIAGNRPANVPRNSASLWTTYQLQGGDWRGLGFGAGLFYVGKRPGDDNNTFELAGYTRTDAAVFHTKGRFTARLNVINVFDREFLLYRTTFNFLVPGAPRTVLGSFEMRF
jgi:iron complex outermembrane receptor protein